MIHQATIKAKLLVRSVYNFRYYDPVIYEFKLYGPQGDWPERGRLAGPLAGRTE
jgi:hypothetical protein